MKKGFVVIAVCVLLLSTLLVGCGETKEGAEQAEQLEKVTVLSGLDTEHQLHRCLCCSEVGLLRRRRA